MGVRFVTWPLKKLRSLPDAGISFGNLLSCFLSMSLLLIWGEGGGGGGLAGGTWQDVGFVQVGYECDSPGISPTVNYTFFHNSMAFPLSKSCFLRLSWALMRPLPNLYLLQASAKSKRFLLCPSPSCTFTILNVTSRELCFVPLK